MIVEVIADHCKSEANKINRVNNDYRGGIVFDLKYQPLCDYEADYYMLHNVSVDNLLEYIEKDLSTNVKKYYNSKSPLENKDQYKYWYKCYVIWEIAGVGNIIYVYDIWCGIKS